MKFDISKHKNILIRIILVIISYVSSWALGYVSCIANTDNLYSQSIFSIICTVVIYFIYDYTLRSIQKTDDRKLLKKQLRYSIILSYSLALSFVAGAQMTALGATLPGVKGKLLVLLYAFILQFVFIPLFYFWFVLIEKRNARKEDSSITLISKKKSRVIFFASFIGIFLCWTLVFLAYYPAIMCYDFNRQVAEAIKGFAYFWAYQPLIHTFLIREFLNLGTLLGSYEIGMALFSLFQMIVLSLVLGYACNLIGRITKKIWPVAVTAIFFALFPIFPIMAVSMTKDVLYSGFLVLFILLLIENTLFTYSSRKRTVLYVIMTIVGIVMLLFRNNGFYAFIFFAIFYVIYEKKERIAVTVMCLLILAGNRIAMVGMEKSMDCIPGSEVEVCSLFFVTFARTAYNQHELLSTEDYTTIDAYISDEIWPYYNPTVSDPIKQRLGLQFEYWKENPVRMIKDWITIGLHYPNEYIDAFLGITQGFWYLDDVTHAEVFGHSIEEKTGILTTSNASKTDVCDEIKSISFIPSLETALNHIVNDNEYMNWPVVSLLFKPAFYCWLLIIGFASFIYNRKGLGILYTMIPMANLFTLYFGPIVQVRYVLPIMMCIPMLFVVSLYRVRKSRSSKDV